MRMRTETGISRYRLGALVAIALVAAVLGIGYRAQSAFATGTYALSASTYNVTEGDPVNITVNRTADVPSDTVRIQLTFTGAPTGGNTATAGVDYVDPGFVTLSFTPGTTTNSYPFSGIENAINDGNRTLTVTISVFDGNGGLTTPTNATITIIDDDGPAKYSYAQPASSVTEGTGGGSQTVNVAVTRSGATNLTDKVFCTVTGGTATGGGSDYTFVSQELVFNPGDTTHNCQISIVRDASTESNDTVIFGFGPPIAGFAGGVGANASHTLTIIDDDGAGTVQFSSATYSAAESGGVASFGVTRTGGSTGAITATCGTTNLASATPGADYTATPTVSFLSWSSGQTTTQFCQVAILPDAILEGPETFGLTLTSANIGSQNSATVTINDDDGAGTLQFGNSSFSGAENGGAIAVTLTRSGSLVGEVSVDVATTTVGSTATAVTDYTPLSTTTVTWTNGDGTSKTVFVSPVDDGIVEGSEFVNVVLSNPVGGASIGSPSTAQVIISDNESPLPVVTSVSPGAGPIAGGTAVTINGINLTGAFSVSFGGSACTPVVVVLSTQITCTTTAHGGGTVDVAVTTPAGTSSTVGTADDFTYTGGPTLLSLNPNTGPAAGNTIVTITGTGFTSSGTTVTFGGVSAVFTFIDSTTLIAASPAHSAGSVDVFVATPGGTTPNTTADDYLYTGASVPVITSVSPTSGNVGTVVVITGTGFNGATSVTFGGVSATFTINSDAQITATVPTGSPSGIIDVRVAAPGGTSANTTNDNFNNTSAATTVTYTLFFRFTLIVWTGPNGMSALAALRGQETPDNPATNNVSTLVGAIWFFQASTQTFKGYFPGSDGVPGANDFTTLTTGAAYFISLLNPGTVTWTAPGSQ